MAGSALSARRAPEANTRSGLGPGAEHRGRAEDAVPAAGGLSFRTGRRYLFGEKTALGIPARTAALPGAKIQAIMVPVGFRIGSKSNASGKSGATLPTPRSTRRSRRKSLRLNLLFHACRSIFLT